MVIRVRPGVEIRPVAEGDAEALDQLVAANRERLARFMPWAADQTLESTREFIRGAIRQRAEDDGFQGVLVVDGTIAGTAGFHRIDRLDSATSIGYWLGAEYERRGLMTDAVRALVEHAFEEWGLHRVELRIAPDNARSRALAARLGFEQEGLLRDAERFGDEYRDLLMYAVLAGEWPAGR